MVPTALGHVASAWMLDRLPDSVNSAAFWTLTAPGRMVAVCPIGGGRAATLFVHRTEDPAAELARGVCATVQNVHAGLGWIVPQLLESLTVPSDRLRSFARELFVRTSAWPITSELLRWRLGLTRRPPGG